MLILQKQLLKLRFILLSFLFLPFRISAEPPVDTSIAFMFKINRTDFYIPDINDGYGVAFRDVNGDNLPDIYLICFRGLNRLLINQGVNRSFKEATIVSGLGGNLMPRGIQNLELGTTIADFDNDGDGDVIIAGWGITTSLYRNNGKCLFTDISQNLNLSQKIDANGGFTADINNDSYLDIFLTDEHYTNHMLLNKKNRSFKDITKLSGLEFNGISQGAGFCDVDRDGDQDLYVTNWFGPDLFYRNMGDGRFVRVPLQIEVCQQSFSTNSVSFSDIDNDGDFDLFVTNREGMNHLYRNESLPGDTSWVFTDITKHAGIIDIGVSYGSVIADFNNDGWLDIFVTNIGVNQFYLNFRNSTFKKIFEDPQPKKNTKIGYSTGAACADFDLDGDLDLFVANKDTFCIFYENPTNNNSYIKFKIQGIKSNRDAVGTRIELYRSGHLEEKEHLLGTREISGGGGYFSLKDPTVHFGLDTVKTIDVKIYFPSGKVITEMNLVCGQTYHIFEYPKITRTIILHSRHFARLIKEPLFWYETLLILIFIILTLTFIRLGLKRYKWNAVTVSGYLAGFFLMALIVITSLKKLGLLSIFSTIDILTITFIMVSGINSERLYRLRLIREKYRSVLISLSNKIIHIRCDTELLTTVAEKIQEHTEFETCCLFIFEKDRQKFVYSVCKGIEIPLNEINSLLDTKKFIQIIQKKTHMLKSSTKRFENIFKILNAEIVIAIQRDNQLFGLISMGTTHSVPPFSSEDIVLFKTIANQMAIALENNAYIRKSNEMIKKLTEAEVREKYMKELETTNKVLDEKNHQLQRLLEELKNTEAQLIHSEKMASLGRLVAGISHELNNPVGFIYSNVKQLKSYTEKIEKFITEVEKYSLSNTERNKLPKTIQIKKIRPIIPDIQNLIEDTIKGSQMVKQLVDNLRQFSHLDRAEWKTADIHEGIESSLMILRPELKDRIKVHKNYKADGSIKCNSGQLNQVFLNLIANAIQAVEDQGNIWISTFDKENNIFIEIKDDGRGMPTDILDKIFDPFFTTKEVGKGTGLGLSISYSIVQNHGGSIEVQSNKGKGSVFRVSLPYERK